MKLTETAVSYLIPIPKNFLAELHKFALDGLIHTEL